MEINIPVSVLSSVGEVVFNVLDGDATAESLAGLDNVVAPIGLPDGNGYHLTFIGGNDGAPIRNPITNKPHSHGAIPHRFRRSGKIIHVEGIIVATKPRYRPILDDGLRSVLGGTIHTGLNPPVFGQKSDALGRFFWKPAGADTRFHAIHLYEPLDITGDGAAPKTFVFSLYSEHPEALTYDSDVPLSEGFIPNDGNTATWPVIRVYATGSFTLSGPGGYALYWNSLATFGDYIEIDMFRQTMYWNGNGANALPYLNMQTSDFFSIPTGGGSVSCDMPIEVFSNDAWVG